MTITAKQHKAIGATMKDLIAENDKLRAAGWRIAAERDRLREINVALAEEIERVCAALLNADAAIMRMEPTEPYRTVVSEITLSHQVNPQA